jgi:hypothetical protein
MSRRPSERLNLSAGGGCALQDHDAKTWLGRVHQTHSSIVAIAIGARTVEVRNALLGVPEAAFVLQLPEQKVRSLLRRGERLARQGRSDSEILAVGALPVTRSGRVRRIRPTDLAAHRKVANDRMALVCLVALVDGRINAPRALSPTEPPPPLGVGTRQLTNRSVEREVGRNERSEGVESENRASQQFHVP